MYIDDNVIEKPNRNLEEILVKSTTAFVIEFLNRENTNVAMRGILYV